MLLCAFDFIPNHLFGRLRHSGWIFIPWLAKTRCWVQRPKSAWLWTKLNMGNYIAWLQIKLKVANTRIRCLDLDFYLASQQGAYLPSSHTYLDNTLAGLRILEFTSTSGGVCSKAPLVRLGRKSGCGENSFDIFSWTCRFCCINEAHNNIVR